MLVGAAPCVSQLPAAAKALLLRLMALRTAHSELLRSLDVLLSEGADVTAVGEVFARAKVAELVATCYAPFAAALGEHQKMLRQSRDYSAFVKRLESDGTAVDALLILPIQRLPRYCLFVASLVDETDPRSAAYAPLVEAQHVLEAGCAKLNASIVSGPNRSPARRRRTIANLFGLGLTACAPV